MIPVYQSPRDIALKLFREASRTWGADTPLNMADHLYNFCVTNSSLRDWVSKVEGVPNGDHAFNSTWRAMADGLFGECADIANAGKHFLVKTSGRIAPVEETLVALGPNGPVEGSEMVRESYELVLQDGRTYDLLMFIHLTCKAWEKYFEESTVLGGPLPEYSYFMFRVF
jgi:hypothetical protein